MRKLIPFVSSLALLAFSASCGKNGSSSGSSSATPGQMEVATADGSNFQGTYRATFKTLNPQINGTVPGSVTMMRNDDRLFVYVRMFAGGVKAWHPQNVYTGRCPVPSDDTNGDGFVDINEANAVLGQILIPLDSDVGSQLSGRNFFPMGDISGSYYYERLTSFSHMLRDLQSSDSNPNDNIVKLGADEGLSILGKPVLVQGVANDVQLPETVGSIPRYKNVQTLPVVCGTFEKIPDNLLSTLHTDDDPIPGPVAPVDPSWDHAPAPGEGEVAGTGTTPPPATNNTTTNTNTTDNHGGNSDGHHTSTTGSSTGGSTTGGTTGSTTDTNSTGSTTGGTTGSDGTSTNGGNHPFGV